MGARSAKSFSLGIAALVAACNLSGAGTPEQGEPKSPRATVRRVKVDRPGLPLEGLSATELSRFKQGDALFDTTLRESDGLGPLYVRDACSACHAGDGRGPGLVTKVGVKNGDTALAAKLFPFGNTERPYATAGAKTALLAPPHPDLLLTARLPPAVFGRGYLEAIADRDIEQLAALASARTGSARGRLHRLKNGQIGRLGLKARLATLEQFAADALSSDMGVSSPQYPEEPRGPEELRDDAKPGVDFTGEQVARLGDYLRGLAIPERREASAAGQRAFEAAGCSVCHVASFTTDAKFPVAALAGVRADVYTDLLLHDMGAAMSDGLTEGDAGPREFRTAPLMGLRFLPSLLHDGRATTVREAIFAHSAADSEAYDSTRRFLALSEAEQRALVAFVEAL
jgi:CxxC motif-containing protein (DUF1111 family)